MQDVSKILVTGGAGFIGSHIAEFYAHSRENSITVIDNLSRSNLLAVPSYTKRYNWTLLSKYDNVKLLERDIKRPESLSALPEDSDIIFHTAAQTAVTTSITDPATDFQNNLVGTFNVLETARKSRSNPTLLYCSTNKVYGDNVNSIPIIEDELRYKIANEFGRGIPESFPIDLTGHTPYGCSKLAGDLYVQDYAYTYGLKTAAFRMSCIYGPRQFGVEDQGWVAWFAIANILGKQVRIYGNGKQVRDLLYISDLVSAFDTFVNLKSARFGVYNLGGGFANSLSLLELLKILEELTGKRSQVTFHPWRLNDQRVYYTDTDRASQDLNWAPRVDTREGMRRLTQWVLQNRELFIDSAPPLQSTSGA